jgi:HK97 family phage major capsid protein
MNTFKPLLKLNIQFFSADNSMSFTTPDGVHMTASEWKQYQQYKKEAETKINRPYIGGGAHGGVKSIGQQFVESDAYKNFLTKGGATSDAFKIERKALVTSRDVGGELMGNVPIIGGAERGFTIRDLLSVGNATSNAIDYMEETGYTNASAMVAEGTLKPESTMTFENRTALVKTLAHHIPATKQIIADAPSMQAHLNSRLIYGLKLTEETQLLFGDGVGENLGGIMTAAGTADYTGAAGETRLDSIRKSFTSVYNSEYQPDGLVLSPTDWEQIEMAKTTTGEYLLNSVNSGGEKRLFGIPVVVTSAMPAGSFLAGNFSLGGQIFDREEVNVQIATQHADDFTRNQIRILVEERLAFAIYRPSAFVVGAFATA